MTPFTARPDEAAAKPRRGEIWEVDFRGREGREQKGIRAALVVSTDSLNLSNFGTIVVCPLTTTERASFRWRPGFVPADLRVADVTWTPYPHWVQTDQIVTVDMGRVRRQLAQVIRHDKMQMVDASLRLLLGMQ